LARRSRGLGDVYKRQSTNTMTTEQTAQQLELAAQILRTGHPWGYRRIAGSRYKYNTPIEVVADGNLLIPLLATPPDGRPLHNPDNLTAEQVGVGYRLTLKGEPTNLHVELQEYWSRGEWQESGEVYTTAFGAHQNARYTYRLPLSVPWPEPADPYAELQTKDVELGPKDFPPCSALKGPSDGIHEYALVCGVGNRGVLLNDGRVITFNHLKSGWKINRSLPLTGKWNPDAWEPCHKTLPA
jgi:hypothetical protein